MSNQTPRDRPAQPEVVTEEMKRLGGALIERWRDVIDVETLAADVYTAMAEIAPCRVPLEGPPEDARSNIYAG